MLSSAPSGVNDAQTPRNPAFADTTPGAPPSVGFKGWRSGLNDDRESGDTGSKSPTLAKTARMRHPATLLCAELDDGFGDIKDDRFCNARQANLNERPATVSVHAKQDGVLRVFGSVFHPYSC
jgi:hypothetical protein